MEPLCRRSLVMLFVLLATPLAANSQTLTAVWDPNPAADQVTSYQVCIGTTSLSCNFKNATVSSTESSYVFTPNPGVLYRVAVRAANAAGPGSYSSEVTVSTPAIATIANRTSTLNTAISAFTVTASDPDGGTLKFTHTGLPIGLTLNQSTGVITGTPTTAGAFNVTIFVNDGLVTSSASFVWTIQGAADTTAPALSITSHTNGQTVSSANITLAGTATDSGVGNSGIASVTVNGSPASSGTATLGNTANWSRALTLVNGSNLLTVVATDGAGNARTAQITVNLSVPATDTTPPNVSITSHTPGQTVTTPSITLAGTASDSGTGGSGITRVTVNGVTTSGGTATGSNTATWSVTGTLVTGGNLFTVVATDGSGNARTTQITINLSSSPPPTDTTAPSLSITSHTSGQTVTTPNITLSGTAGDSGSGGSGIAQVTVNGTVASGSTAAGNNVAFWGAAVTLVSGSNVFTVAATDGAGNVRTTQITINLSSVTAPAVGANSVTPNTGSGTSQTFAMQFSDSRGAAQLRTVWVWFAGGNSMCLVYHDRTTNMLNLIDDAGASWMATPLGSGTLQNGSCSVASDLSSASVSGANLTLNLAVTFTPSMSGPKTVRLFANSAGTLSSGWQDRGTWTVPTPPTVPPGVSAISATPGSGSGNSQTFVLQYSDSRGATSLVSEWVWFSGNPGHCLVAHDRATDNVYLLNDAGTGWLGQKLGSGTLQNSYCSINVAGTSVSLSGGMLTLTLPVTFNTPAFSGTKTIQMFANAAGELASGWQNRGSWIVP
ncbi:MAG TPA: putative Ig domain-containing protein [Vicinamibacterales bacterium]|jgi:hypothetical protein